MERFNHSFDHDGKAAGTYSPKLKSFCWRLLSRTARWLAISIFCGKALFGATVDDNESQNCDVK